MDIPVIKTNFQNYVDNVSYSLSVTDASIIDLRNSFNVLSGNVYTKEEIDAINEEISNSVSNVYTKAEIDAKEEHIIDGLTALNDDINEINSSISDIKAVIGNATDTSNSLYGLINQLIAQFEDYELITATALTDVSARLDLVQNHIDAEAEA